MIEVIEYEDREGRNPFRRWFEGLGFAAATRIEVALNRIEQGNLSNAKSVGQGVSEYRVNFGPGYRIYFGRQGDSLVILLGGGTKQRQHRDIESARGYWREYRRRRRREV